MIGLTRILSHIVLLASALVAVGFVTGCGSSRQSSPYSDDHTATRNITAANEAWEAARAVRHSDPESAMALLREALGHDLYHGPAHNDLGVLLLQQGRLYDAAVEFEWARKQMPGHPDPRVNLAITLERGGQVDEAIEAASAALDVQQGYLPAVQALATIQLKHRREDEQTLQLLDLIRSQSNEPAWRTFAERHYIRLTSPATTLR